MVSNSWRLNEDKPTYGKSLDVAEGVRRIVAPNSGSMTYHGTNTWLITTDNGVAVVDPGTDAPEHLDAICAASGTISNIIVTHWHHDHFDGAYALAERVGGLVSKFPAGPVRADRALEDGDIIAGMRVIHTPGHAKDHICLLRPDGVMLTGDHVMGWSTTMIPPPPEGDLGDYMISLNRLKKEKTHILLPGHGPVIQNPIDFIDHLLIRRFQRLEQIENMLTQDILGFGDVFRKAYPQVKDELQFAAKMMLESHLQELKKQGKALQINKGWKKAIII